jgi:peptide/nickel transport system substrate-binding protein
MGKDSKPLPYIDGIQIIGATGNAQGSMRVIAGEVDWGTYNIANIEKVFKQRDPENNHYWLPGGSIVYLNLNNGKEPFSNPDLRKAIFQAIDPVEVTRIMNSGALPASQAGVNKGYLGWVPKAAQKHALSYNPAEAMKRIEAQGYTKNSKGIYEKEGKTLSFDVYVPTGWNDWITAVDVVCNQLRKVGIEGRVTQNAWPSPFFDNIKTGAYDISIDYASAGFSPYYQYNNILPSRHWAPIGENSSTKHSQVRYKNTDVDMKMAEYSKTADSEEQVELIGDVLTAVMRDTPLVPLFNNPTWFTYSTRRFVGWPNEDNPYVAPKTSGMDKLMIYLSIQPK